MAAQGLRHEPTGTERIVDKNELAAIRRVGNRVIREGAITAVLFTAVMTFGA